MFYHVSKEVSSYHNVYKYMQYNDKTVLLRDMVHQISRG